MLITSRTTTEIITDVFPPKYVENQTLFADYDNWYDLSREFSGPALSY